MNLRDKSDSELQRSLKVAKDRSIHHRRRYEFWRHEATEIQHEIARRTLGRRTF